MLDGHAAIHYGFAIIFEREEAIVGTHQFPQANFGDNGGCIIESVRTMTVRYCPQCRCNTVESVAESLYEPLPSEETVRGAPTERKRWVEIRLGEAGASPRDWLDWIAEARETNSKEYELCGALMERVEKDATILFPSAEEETWALVKALLAILFLLSAAAVLVLILRHKTGKDDVRSWARIALRRRRRLGQ